MTGDDASKDLASPFASFVAAAWASLGNDLPEISWASQIRRRRDTLSAAELVRWANFLREFPLKHVHPELPPLLVQTSRGPWDSSGRARYDQSKCVIRRFDD